MMRSIPSLAQQIAAAARHAAMLKDEALAAPKNCIRPAMRNGRYGGNGLKDALLARLPVGRENAIRQPAVRALLTDIDYAANGLTSALSVLANNGLICRAGLRGHYLYYRNP